MSEVATAAPKAKKAKAPKADAPATSAAKAKSPPKMSVTVEAGVVTAECEGVKATLTVKGNEVRLNGELLPAATVAALILGGIPAKLRSSISGAKTPEARKQRFENMIGRMGAGTLGQAAPRTSDPVLKKAMELSVAKVRLTVKPICKEAGIKVKEWIYKDKKPGEPSIRAAAAANREKFIAQAREEIEAAKGKQEVAVTL